MTLNPKDRERIVEEETLRFETRRGLAHADGHCSGRRCRSWRWLWFVAFFLLGYAVRGCRDHRAGAFDGSCRWGSSMFQGHCPFAQPQAGQPAGAAVSPDVKSTPQP